MPELSLKEQELARLGCGGGNDGSFILGKENHSHVTAITLMERKKFTLKVMIAHVLGFSSLPI